MTPHVIHLLIEQRRRDLARDADLERLSHMVRSRRQPLRERLGSTFVRWGVWLAGAEPVQLRRRDCVA